MTAGAPAGQAAPEAARRIAPEAVPYLPRGVRLRFDAVRDTWVLLAPERAIRLDQIGHAILSRVDGARSFGAITRDLAETFHAPEDQIAKDSAGYLSALIDRRILELRP